MKSNHRRRAARRRFWRSRQGRVVMSWRDDQDNTFEWRTVNGPWVRRPK